MKSAAGNEYAKHLFGDSARWCWTIWICNGQFNRNYIRHNYVGGMLSSSGRKSRAVNESIIDFHDNERNGKKEKRRKEGKKISATKANIECIAEDFWSTKIYCNQDNWNSVNHPILVMLYDNGK